MTDETPEEKPGEKLDGKNKKSGEVRISISKQQIIIFAAIVGVIAAGVYGYIAYVTYFAPVFSANFEGLQLGFRADLREAQKIEVVPDESSLQNFFARPLSNVTIAFRPVSQQTNGWYSVEATEIVIKLNIFYKTKYGAEPSFNGIEVDSYENLNGTRDAPIVALIHPEIADGTFVKLDEGRNVVTISGGNSLRDFDLATAKFMMVALGINV